MYHLHHKAYYLSKYGNNSNEPGVFRQSLFSCIILGKIQAEVLRLPCNLPVFA